MPPVLTYAHDSAGSVVGHRHLAAGGNRGKCARHFGWSEGIMRSICLVIGIELAAHTWDATREFDLRVGSHAMMVALRRHRLLPEPARVVG